jgi:hypothetical protein
MTFLLTCEGAEKCALRHLRRDEDTAALNFIAAGQTRQSPHVRIAPPKHCRRVSSARLRAAPAHARPALPRRARAAHPHLLCR